MHKTKTATHGPSALHRGTFTRVTWDKSSNEFKIPSEALANKSTNRDWLLLAITQDRDTQRASYRGNPTTTIMTPLTPRISPAWACLYQSIIKYPPPPTQTSLRKRQGTS